MKVKIKAEFELPSWFVRNFRDSPFRDKRLPLKDGLTKEIRETLETYVIEYDWFLEKLGIEFLEEE